jgi:hypothetical protein
MKTDGGVINNSYRQELGRIEFQDRKPRRVTFHGW